MFNKFKSFLIGNAYIDMQHLATQTRTYTHTPSRANISHKREREPEHTTTCSPRHILLYFVVFYIAGDNTKWLYHLINFRSRPRGVWVYVCVCVRGVCQSISTFTTFFLSLCIVCKPAKEMHATPLCAANRKTNHKFVERFIRRDSATLAHLFLLLSMSLQLHAKVLHISYIYICMHSNHQRRPRTRLKT